MMMSVFIQLFNVLSVVSWLQHPIYSLFLTLDGIVYSLVSYSYKLFMIMAQLNYNVIYEMMSPLIDRVKAVIMVFILFKVGVSFLQYLVDPDKFMEKKAGGKALVINILITAGLLGIYTFVFQLGNDVSMLVLGTFGGSASYKVLPTPVDNTGILARLIFGSSSQMDNVGNFGKYLSASTLNIFLHDKDDSKTKEASAIYNEVINNDEEDWGGFEKIIDLADDIGRTVEYRFPILSTFMGAYLIFTIVKIAIEIGIRMFKLIILQIIAPIPICSIVSSGLGGGMFKKFTDLYMSTFISAFVRVGSMYLMTGFIGVFYEQIMSGGSEYGDIFNIENGIEMGWFTKALLFIMILVAGYKFVQALPEFLKGLFGDLGANSVGGFGKFMKQAAGFGIGAAAGLATGIATGAGVGGTLMNAALSGYNGGKAGGEKGPFIANQIKNLEGAAGRANSYANDGGLLNHLGNTIDEKTGAKAVREGNADRDIQDIQSASADKQKQIDAVQQKNAKIQAVTRAAAANVKRNTTFAGGHKNVTSAEDLYNRRIATNSSFAVLKDRMNNGATEAERTAAAKQYNALCKSFREQSEHDYNTALEGTAEFSSSGLGTVANSEKELETNNYQIQTLSEEKAAIDQDAQDREKGKGNFEGVAGKGARYKRTKNNYTGTGPGGGGGPI